MSRRRMNSLQRLGLAAALALLAAGFFAASSSSAATLSATWSIYSRADATSFVPGQVPGPPAGYEIISFDAVPVSVGSETYIYAGADLPAARGGPMAPLVTCTTAFDTQSLSLEVAGGYPYAGCVFFVGVTNTGDLPVRFHLGPLGAEATSSCNVAGCDVSDIDILAGATGPDPLVGCRTEGGAPEPTGDVHALLPGASVVCPIFIVVLQPATENTTYLIEITPPVLQEAPLQEGEDSPVGFSSLPPVVQQRPPTPEPALPPTPAPTVAVAGNRTPGPGISSTPVAPATGETLAQRRSVDQAGPAAALLMLTGVGLLIVLAWPRRDHPIGRK